MTTDANHQGGLEDVEIEHDELVTLLNSREGYQEAASEFGRINRAIKNIIETDESLKPHFGKRVRAENWTFNLVSNPGGVEKPAHTTKDTLGIRKITREDLAART